MAAEATAEQSRLERKGTSWVVGILIALLFGITNLPWTLDDYDQAKQAFTSFEMVNEGHWLFQHTPNEKVATKPPLVGWISAALYGLTRSWEVAWRLPSMAAALILLLVLRRAAAQAYGTGAGLIAMSAFGLNLLSPRLATLVRTDMPLALVLCLIGLTIWRKVRSGESWSQRDRVVVFALLTASMLIKGPIVYAFLLPGIFVFEWRQRGTTAQASAWCGWWPWIASLGVFLLWAGIGIFAVPGFYEQVVLREFAGRFSETVHRSQPLYFYWPHLLHKFAPWSVLLIALAVLKWRTVNLQLRERWSRLSPDIAWLLCWSLGGLIVMSLIPSKRVDRIFPIVPPLCLLLAAVLRTVWSDEQIAARARRWCTIALLFASVFTSGYAAQRLILSSRAGDGALAEFSARVRREATVRGWRYEVIGGREEGLLLYLRRTHFLRPEEAVARWNADALDALVAPAEELPGLLARLPGSTASGLEGSVTINDQPRRYVLLTRAAL